MPVTLPKDAVRARQTKTANRCRALGIDLDAERQLYGANSRALNAAAKKLINDATPRTSEESFVIVSPPDGSFDGVNTTYTLPSPVSGLNIGVTYHNAALNIARPLTRSAANPPAADAFFFDVSAPSQFIVGTPPQAADMLIVTYKRG